MGFETSYTEVVAFYERLVINKMKTFVLRSVSLFLRDLIVTDGGFSCDFYFLSMKT